MAKAATLLPRPAPNKFDKCSKQQAAPLSMRGLLWFLYAASTCNASLEILTPNHLDHRPQIPTPATPVPRAQFRRYGKSSECPVRQRDSNE